MLLFVIGELATLAPAGLSGGPALSPEQVAIAIQTGSRYKTAQKYFQNGLNGISVELASSMAMDAISKHVTFFDDFQAVAMNAAWAHQMMRETTPEEVRSSGLLHAWVEVHARGSIATGKIDRRFGPKRSNLVLRIGERIVQPVDQSIISKSGQSTAMAVLGANSAKIVSEFLFDVSVEDLASPIEVILVDGDGNKHHHTATLAGILSLEDRRIGKKK